jgi:hypothetical protein
MSFYQGVSTKYKNTKVDDVIQDITKIDSVQDVLGATATLNKISTTKSELNNSIISLQLQVSTQANLIATLQDQIDQNLLLIQELQNFVIAFQNNN